MAKEMAIKITTGQNMAVMELPLKMKPAIDRGQKKDYVGWSQTLRGE